MITNVSSAAALNAALKTAAPGDIIQLASGTYAGISATNLHFATDVTVTAAPNAQTVLTSLTVSGSSGLTFSNLEFYADPAGAQNPFLVRSGSDGIHFDHLSVHGSMDGNPQDDVAAFLLRDSTNLSVTNSEFQQLWMGVGHLNDTGLTLSGNTFHDIRTDGIRGGGSSNVTITGNSFHDFYPAIGDHPDGIQFWSTNTNSSAHDITVSNNLFERGAGGTFQGVFIRDDTGALPFLSVQITGNWVVGGAFNGIAVMGAGNLTIDGNYVQGFADQESWIRVENTNGGVVSNNSANTYVTTSTDSNLTMTNDATIPQASDGGAAALALWQQAHVAGLVINGTAGNDTLMGGAGDDTINGGTGADVLTGGGGDDLYVIDAKATIVEAATGGIDTVQTSVSYTLPANVENLVMTGTKGLIASGNGLANVMTGNSGANNLAGGAGDDTLAGGGGADTLTGGTGADHFVFAQGDGHDVITDFGAHGDHDVLDISSFLKAGLTPTLTETTAGVTVSFATGDSVLLQGQHIANLHATELGYAF